MSKRSCWQSIRTNRTYTIEDMAIVCGVHVGTVRRWITNDGLSIAVIDETRPILISGKLAREWMRRRERDRKQPCGPGEIYCVTCKAPRAIRPGSTRITSPKPPKITLEGDCTGCDRTIRRFDTEANREALSREFALIHTIAQGRCPAPKSVPAPPLKCSLHEGNNDGRNESCQ